MTDEEWKKLILKHKLLGSPFKFNDDAGKRELVYIDKDFDGVIEIPNGVLEIRNGCFKNSEIREVYIPDSVCVIGEQAFYNCWLLTKVRYSSNLNLVPRQCFYECRNLEVLENFSNVMSIHDEAFMYCKSLREVSKTIFPSIQEIKKYAFSRSGIKKLVLGDTMRYLYEGCFYSCINLRFADISGLRTCYWMAEEANLGHIFNGCNGECEFILPSFNSSRWESLLGFPSHENGHYSFQNIKVKG